MVAATDKSRVQSQHGCSLINKKLLSCTRNKSKRSSSPVGTMYSVKVKFAFGPGGPSGQRLTPVSVS